MSIPPLLDSLLRAAGPSGRETAPAQIWRDACAQFTDAVDSDSLGSSWARVSGAGGGLTLAVVGHIDEIGLHVTHIDDDGYLRFGPVGGWDPMILIGQRVTLMARAGAVSGVIGRKPIHLVPRDERTKGPKLEDLHIDIGVGSAEEASEYVRIGDTAVIDVAPVEFPNGRLVSRALDNRIGCFVSAEVARRVAESGPIRGDLLAMAVVQEETGLAGSTTSAFNTRPDLAIVVDVTHATDQPGVELGALTGHALGSGPVIPRDVTLHPTISDLLQDTATKNEIPFTPASLSAATGTDADAVSISRAGIPTGVVSVPLRYMHSPVELVALADIEATIQLVTAFARSLDPSPILQR